MKKFGFSILIALLVAAAVPAKAAVYDWTLSGVSFSDGGTASGTLTFGVIVLPSDVELTAYNIVTTTGSVLSGNTYQGTTAQFVSSVGFDLSANSELLHLNFSALSLDSPSSLSGYEFVGGNFRTITSGSITASIPEPSTWAMLLLGFAGLGFMAYRRKSKPALMAA
jgi:PEP-CTERM motif